MIIKAILAIVFAITNWITSIMPDVPIIPVMFTEVMAWAGNLIIMGSDILEYILGETFFRAVINYVVMLLVFTAFRRIVRLVNLYALNRS